MSRKSTRTAAEAKKLPPLSNVDRGRLMAQTAASIRTINAWWNNDEHVKPVTRRALEQAARRLRIMVPHRSSTTVRGETAGKRDSQRPPSAAQA